MIRVLLTVILPLLLPTAIYLLWLQARRRPEAMAAGELLRRLPLAWLAAAGVALTAAVLVMVSLGYGGGGSGDYVPPHTENGKLVPGHIEPARQN